MIIPIKNSVFLSILFIITSSPQIVHSVRCFWEFIYDVLSPEEKLHVYNKMKTIIYADPKSPKKRHEQYFGPDIDKEPQNKTPKPEIFMNPDIQKFISRHRTNITVKTESSVADGRVSYTYFLDFSTDTNILICFLCFLVLAAGLLFLVHSLYRKKHLKIRVSSVDSTESITTSTTSDSTDTSEYQTSELVTSTTSYSAETPDSENETSETSPMTTSESTEDTEYKSCEAEPMTTSESTEDTEYKSCEAESEDMSTHTPSSKVRAYLKSLVRQLEKLGYREDVQKYFTEELLNMVSNRITQDSYMKNHFEDHLTAEALLQMVHLLYREKRPKQTVVCPTFIQLPKEATINVIVKRKQN